MFMMVILKMILFDILCSLNGINVWVSLEEIKLLVGFPFKWCHASLLANLVKSNVFCESTEGPCVQTSFTHVSYFLDMKHDKARNPHM